ncbi:methyltransferase RsmF C-terminal domain-like protein [Allobaculum fili]|uniref:methyltransferase RsmF C-terminal domain-like protein n=1 Tax=Allobaculum fili TaxID=2834460 RepID=UPI001E61EC3B|nr:methyltransferase domain-containing protein [Allobaculum fili]
MEQLESLYEKRMRTLLGDEFDAYQNSLSTPLYQGLRISSSKQDPQITRKNLPFLSEVSPFADHTWYIHQKAGLTPEHLQGLIYLQEPSASGAVSILNVQPDDTVLDLCAAPGSKSTQIAEKLGRNGFLVSNEIDPKRAQILAGNLERMGAENVCVTNMDSPSICSQTEGLFDKVLVDAPCSGEGMMKKHEIARDDWSIENVLLCAARQKDILKEAWKALKPGGELVYSTCTYAPEENEGNVAWLLSTFEDAKLLPVDVIWGREGFATNGLDASKAALVRRVFPMDGGEGHFMARFMKTGESEESAEPVSSSRKKGKGSKGLWLSADKLPKEAASFLDEQLEADERGVCGYSFYHVIERKDESLVFGMNHPFLNLKKGKVIRQGVLIGSVLRKRFEPDFAFYLSETAARHLKTKTETLLEEMDAYYHGQQLPLQAPAGFRALCYQGIPYGFGKSSAGRITNKLPKGLRLLPGSAILKGGKTEDDPAKA